VSEETDAVRTVAGCAVSAFLLVVLVLIGVAGALGLSWRMLKWAAGH
jgi:hypothetical protein